jgi:hypothetical protein
LGKRHADHRLLSFHHRSADTVRSDGLYFGHRRLLLIFAWMQNRNTPALAFWGVGPAPLLVIGGARARRAAERSAAIPAPIAG